MAAYVLTQAGARVVMLEAGPEWFPERDSSMLTWPYQSPRRGASTQKNHFGEFDACYGMLHPAGYDIADRDGTLLCLPHGAPHGSSGNKNCA